MRAVVLISFLAFPALAETCPPSPDHGAAVADLLARARAAPDEAAARPLTRQMWELWTDAPDAHAQ